MAGLEPVLLGDTQRFECQVREKSSYCARNTQEVQQSSTDNVFTHFSLSVCSHGIARSLTLHPWQIFSFPFVVFAIAGKTQLPLCRPDVCACVWMKEMSRKKTFQSEAGRGAWLAAEPH